MARFLAMYHMYPSQMIVIVHPNIQVNNMVRKLIKNVIPRWKHLFTSKKELPQSVEFFCWP
mgnify:CR=1 FL=1